ncbi:zinc finger Ran-binding domain-containing protein [Actinoplanes awajinensis]|uniref:Uncharacterized protein n=1 Tax=Actinoplanes awajinensis subsp. mycoplanecinus TaxID=135947 RepID=A0A0X3V520_9ACTN|nr:zinc finger Ran-binding domain-containing protein [Actinoplanes awajinensis]KUL39899.1 hypothetical protein ADL15_08740 [Actinoplanes awajinensis subsp. mycoplanecinus]
MRCEACGLDNDPSLEYCDNCEHPLRDSGATVISAPQPVAVPRPRPAPAPAPRDDDDDDYDYGYDRDATRVVVPGPPPAPSRPLTRPVLIGVAVLALAGAAGGVALALHRDEKQAVDPGPVASSTFAEPPASLPPSEISSPSPSPTVDPAVQGAAVDQLLDQSGQSRLKLVEANDVVFSCGDLAGAIERLQEVGTERGAERAALNGLDLSALTNGEQIRSTLDTAFSHSLAADRHYVKWAQERQGNGCRKTAKAEAHRIAGDAESTSAGAAKKQFLSLWNPVAVGLGLPARERDGI